MNYELVLFTFSTFSFAQTFSFGPKAGINVSNYSGGDINSDAKVGYHLSGMLNFGFGESFSIQPEVLFSTQGAKVSVILILLFLSGCWLLQFLYIPLKSF